MLVRTEALTKRYGRLAALENCALSVGRGEVFGLLGPNGAGKTTLLRLLLGFLRPTAGAASIAGLDCYRQSTAVHRLVTYLPGEAKLPARMRASGVVELFGRLRGGDTTARAIALAERLALDLTRPVAQMSTGMRQKLALATVLAVDAPLVILDEPTSNLDPSVRGEVLALVRQARHEGRTVLFSSHVMAEVEQSCDRVAILRGGRLVHEQVISELLRKHRIRAHLTGPMPAVPERLAATLAIQPRAGDEVLIETSGELAPLLGYLATLPLKEVRIEPLGLQSVYERFHAIGGEEPRT